MIEPFFEQAAIARERYLSFYRRFIEALKTDPNLAVEVLVQPNGRTSSHPFCLMRVDAILGGAEEPQVHRVADEILPSHTDFFVLDSGLQIHQERFSWEALRLAFSSEAFRVEHLETWLREWLDSDEKREPDSNGLSGVVHDLAWALGERHSWVLDIDLGSAPLDAIQELFELLHQTGVTRIDLSSHDTENVDA